MMLLLLTDLLMTLFFLKKLNFCVDTDFYCFFIYCRCCLVVLINHVVLYSFYTASWTLL